MKKAHYTMGTNRYEVVAADGGMDRDEVATADGTAGYGLDNAWRNALARLRSLEDWLDPGTIRHRRARGVGTGWRCLEVGAGAAWGRRPWALGVTRAR
jgi:hypothetical protein